MVIERERHTDTERGIQTQMTSKRRASVRRILLSYSRERERERERESFIRKLN
jgi:hypothetical protein